MALIGPGVIIARALIRFQIIEGITLSRAGHVYPALTISQILEILQILEHAAAARPSKDRRLY